MTRVAHDGTARSGRAAFLAVRAWSLAFGAALVVGAWAAHPARAGGEAEAVPPPPKPTAPPPSSGKNLDELLAVVEGELITRRSLVREVGERPADWDEREYEERLKVALVRRAELRLYYKAAERMGITLTQDAIEEITREKAARLVRDAKEQAEKNKPGSSATITLDKILEEKGLSREEYKTVVAKDEMRRRYFTVLIRGVPGKRAVVDTEASPEDVRRLYAAHKAAFDVKPGARFAFWVVHPVDFLGEGSTLTWDQAKAASRAKADALLADFARDQDVGRAAAAAGLKRDGFATVPVGEFREREELLSRRGLEPVVEWIYADGRVTGETQVIETKRGDVFAVAVLELRPARTRTFDEVQKELMALVSDVRLMRFVHQHTLELLGRAQIWPSRLAEALEERARDELRKIEEHPVKKDIRLR